MKRFEFAGLVITAAIGAAVGYSVSTFPVTKPAYNGGTGTGLTVRAACEALQSPIWFRSYAAGYCLGAIDMAIRQAPPRHNFCYKIEKPMAGVAKDIVALIDQDAAENRAKYPDNPPPYDNPYPADGSVAVEQAIDMNNVCRREPQTEQPQAESPKQ